MRHIVALALLLTSATVAAQDQAVDALRAKHALEQGAKLTLDDFNVQQVPLLFAPRSHVKLNGSRAWVGARLKIALAEGDYLLWTAVDRTGEAPPLLEELPPNMRAVTVRAAAPGPVPFLKGDSVDVIATGLPAGRAVVENVWILHPGTAAADEPRNVVLVTTAEQAEMLLRVQELAAANLGADLEPVNLTLVRRGRGPAKAAAPKPPSSHK